MRLYVLLGILILNIAAFAAGQQLAAIAKIIEGVDQFSGKFVKQVAKGDRKNFAVSPLGAYLALANPSFGARRHTEEVFNEILGLTDVTSDTKRIGVDLMNRYLETFNPSELSVQSGIYVSPDIELLPDFIITVTTVGHSWVQKVTEKSAPLGVTVLANHVHFNGTSMKQFEPISPYRVMTDEISFTFENGRSTQSMTFLRGLHAVKVGVCPETNAQFIEIPYQADVYYHNMSMFLIFTPYNENLVHLEENFDKISVQKLHEVGKTALRHMILPKFKIDRTLELKDSLKRMGLDHIFETRNTDFSGMFSPSDVRSRNNIVSDPGIHTFFQKASVEMDGRGVNNWRHIDDDYITWTTLLKPFYVIIATTGPISLNILTARFTGEE